MTTSKILNVSQFVKPVKIKIEKAKITQQSQPSELSIERERGGFNMKNHPIKQT
jgi:hypothetical protein